MLYNKNQFRKTNDKKVLHKIGKHWVTVSVAFLSLLGLGAVSTMATTHADTTDNANAQTTSAAPNSNSADSIQKQVTKQANALHNQLLGHAAVSQKPAQQGTARLGSVNGRVNQAQTQNAQQSKKPANNQMSANHSNVMRLGANAQSQDQSTNGQKIDTLVTNGTFSNGQNGKNFKLTYNLYSDAQTPQNTAMVPHWVPATSPMDWLSHQGPNNGKNSKDTRSPYSYKYLNQSNYNTTQDAWASGPTDISRYNKFASKYFPGGKISTSGPNKGLYVGGVNKDNKVQVNNPIPGIKNHNYQVEFTGGTINNMSNFLYKLRTNIIPRQSNDIVALKFDKGIDTRKLKDMNNALGNAHSTSTNPDDTSASDSGNSGANLESIEGLDNFKTDNVINMIDLFKGDGQLSPLVANQLKSWTFKYDPSSYKVYPDSVVIMAKANDMSYNDANSDNPEPHADSDMFSDATLLNSDVTLLPTGKVGNKYHFNINSVLYQGKYDGLNFNYNANSKRLEFTSGNFDAPIHPTVNQQGTSNWFSGPLLSNAIKNSVNVNPNVKCNDKASDVKSIKFDSGVTFGNNTQPNDFTAMFAAMPQLQTVDMSDANASSDNIKDMGYMFKNDPALENVYFPKNMDLSHITNMSYMFNNDHNLHYINLNSSDSRKGFNWIGHAKSDQGVNMTGMFESDRANNSNGDLSDVISNGHKNVFTNNGNDENSLHNFDTSNVTSMNSMFKNSKFDEMQLPASFDTSKVTDMEDMFDNVGFTKTQTLDSDMLDLGINFNTQNVKNMGGMFANNPGLYSLNLTSDIKYNYDMGPEDTSDFHNRYDFNTSNVTDMNTMFAYDDNLKSIRFPDPSSKNRLAKNTDNPGFDTNNVKNMSSMFESDNNINLTLPNSFDTTNVSDMSNMFANSDNDVTSHMGDDTRQSVLNNWSNPANNSENLTLPVDFFIDGHVGNNKNNGMRNNTNMFRNAKLESLTLSSNGSSDKNTKMPLTNTVFSNTTTGMRYSDQNGTFNLKLYRQKNPSQYGDTDYRNANTSLSPEVFDATPTVAGTFSKKTEMPTELSYRDIYSNIDGNLDWKLAKIQEPIDQSHPVVTLHAPNGGAAYGGDWVFIDPNGNPTDHYSDIAHNKQGQALVAPVYKGFIVKYNATDHSVEFVSGHVNGKYLNSDEQSSRYSMKGFDDPQISSDNVAPDNGHYTIDHMVTHAQSLTFDGPTLKNTLAGTSIKGVSDMSDAFANPNLKHINFNGVFDMSKVSDMNGMFQGTQISDLELPAPQSDWQDYSDGRKVDGFVTTSGNKVFMPSMTNAFATANNPATGKPYLNKLVIPKVLGKYDNNQLANDSGLPTVYKSLQNGYTGYNPANSDLFNKSNVTGIYLTTPHAQLVKETIKLVYTDPSDSKLDYTKMINLGSQPVGGSYTLKDSENGIKAPNSKDSLYGYNFTNDKNSNEKQSFTFESNDTEPHTVSITPIKNEPYVQFVYHNAALGQNIVVGRNWNKDTANLNDSNLFNGTILQPTIIDSTNENKYLVNESGWQLDPSYENKSGKVIISHNFNHDVKGIHYPGPYTIYVIPKHAAGTIDYVEPSDGNRVVGHTTFSGNDFNATQAGNNFVDITATSPGLPSDYNLVSPDNYRHYVNGKTWTVPVRRKLPTFDPINYIYGSNQIVGTDSASQFSGSGHNRKASVSNVPGGYHLASGASSAVSDTGDTYEVSVAPNTINENISYVVQNNPLYSSANSEVSEFSSNLNDARTSADNKSFEITSGGDLIPNGYQLSSDHNVNIGPVTTNSASSSVDNTVIVSPDFEHIYVNFIDQNGTQVGHYVDSGYAGNSLNKPIADAYPAHYTLPKIFEIETGKPGNDWATTNVLPTKFSPNYDDETIKVIETPAQATDKVVYVDETNGNAQVGSTLIPGTDSRVLPNASDTSVTINNGYKPGLPTSYVLANSSDSFKIDGQSHSVPVVPNNNVFTVNYQYNGQTIGTQAFSGKKPTDELNINDGNEKGLPAGYSLIDQHNAYGNKFIYADKSANVAVQPNEVSDTINFMNGNQKVGSTTVSGNDYRATAAGNNQAQIANDTKGMPSGYYVMNNPIAVNYDGGTHNIAVAPDQYTDTVNYVYNKQTVGSYQYSDVQGSKFDITNSNQPDMPTGYHLVNKDNQFTGDNGTHDIDVAPNMMNFTVTFTNNGKPVATKTYQGAVNTSFMVNSGTDAPKGYTINNKQNMNYEFDGDPYNNNASLQVTPIAPSDASEIINFLYTNKTAGQVYNEGNTKKTGVKGSQGTITASDYNNIKPGYQVIPNENTYNKGSKFQFNNGSVDIYVEPIQQTDTIWYVNDQTGKLIANDGPFTDTVTKTGNDSKAVNSSDTSFIVGAKPSDLRTDYYAVDNPGQSIPFDGQNHSVTVHLIKQAPYSAQASLANETKAAKAKQAATAASISAQASKIAKEQNSKAASSYANSATSNAASSMATSTTNSVTSTNDTSEYNHEQSSNSSAQSSEASSASASVSSANSSSNNSIASQSTSFSSASIAPASSAIPKSSSASVKPSSASTKPSSKASSASSSIAPSSSPAVIVPFVPTMPSSAPSSVASSSASQSSIASSSVAPVTMTNKNYPITYAKSANKPDMVTYMGRKYPVHYHADGKNTVRVRQTVFSHGKRSYRYRNVVVSTNLPIYKPSSDNLVRAVDRIDFKSTGKHVWTRKGLDKALNNAKPNEVINFHGKKMAVVKDPLHWRYFMVTKDALSHMMILGVGKNDTRRIMRTHHALTIFIRHIVAVHGHKANYVRYEFKVGNHDFWVTGRNDYAPNAYWQKSNFTARHAHYVRVIRPCRLYRSRHYSNKTLIQNVRRGAIVHVAKVVYINRPSYEQTRLVLTNGHYITANKNFVRIVK